MTEPMDAARWTAVQTLFDAALDLPPAERDAYLRDACGDDPDLYREVASLLNIEVHSLLRGLALDAVDVSAVLSREGERVGPYRIEKEIGRGGMGAVFLAERADGAFEQRVALKLVKRGMDSDAVLRRFEQERQILARLQHPGIARLLDGGLAPDGRPYFAMEVVEGEPITAYCDARALSIHDRLMLFERVCEAVAYAHRNLVVHRDLKPSNILVTTDGEVKLLDFGIARLLETDDPGLTWSGLRPMTPEYAAPEQVRGQAITTATDVYALGALLYELLTGRRPHALVDRDLKSIEKAICEDEPERPSLAVGRTVSATAGDGVHTVTPAGVSHARDTTPERLRRQLAGDLDTITLKALRKEPERRYTSADALAADLRRYRDGIPVQARRPTAGYRVRKYVMRHRTGVAATAAAVAVLAAVVGFYTARLAAERDRAQLEATKAEEVSEFLIALFTSSDPAESLGADITARQLLAEGTEQIENDLASQPAVQAKMYGTIGRVYFSLGLLEQAETTLKRSLDLFDTVGAAPSDIARTRTDLGSVYVSLNDFGAADSLLQTALGVLRSSDAGPSEDLAFALEEYGDLLIERGDYPDAEAPYQEALEIRRALHGDEHPATASLLSRIGVGYSRMGRYVDALATHEEALAMHRRLHGDLHPATTESIRETSISHRRLDNFEESEALIREAIALDSQLVGLEHPNLGENYYQYASLLSDIGRFDEATEMFERSLAVDKATLGEDHPYIAITLGDLGQIRQRAGDREGAIEYFRRGVAMARRELPPDHPQLAGLLHKLGEALSLEGALEEAEASIQEALAITRMRLDEDHVQVLSVRSALGSFYVRVGRHDEAIALFRDVLERRQRTQGENSAITARGYYNLSAALRAKGTPESLTEAREVIATGVARYRSVFPSESREVGYALMEQADVFRASEDTTNAVSTYREAERVFRASLGPDHPILGRIDRSLAAMAE